MDTLMTIFSNPVSFEREEEFNNWYSWVHIRDVMGMEGSTAVQRFTLAEAQPKKKADLPKYIALYEIADKAACTKGHADRLNTWQMTVSPAFDFPSHIEGYWDPVHGTSAFAEYADYTGDKSVLLIRAKAKGGKNVEKVFDLATLDEISKLPGFMSAMLFEYADDQMDTTKAGPAEPMSHEVVCQLSNSINAANAWDDFLKKNKDIEQDLNMEVALYEPIIDRFKAADRIKSPEWRAITFLSHAIMTAIENGILKVDSESADSVW